MARLTQPNFENGQRLSQIIWYSRRITKARQNTSNVLHRTFFMKIRIHDSGNNLSKWKAQLDIRALSSFLKKKKIPDLIVNCPPDLLEGMIHIGRTMWQELIALMPHKFELWGIMESAGYFWRSRFHEMLTDGRTFGRTLWDYFEEITW